MGGGLELQEGPITETQNGREKQQLQNHETNDQDDEEDGKNGRCYDAA